MDAHQHDDVGDGARSLGGAGDEQLNAATSVSEEATEDEEQIHPFFRALQIDLVADKLLSLINFEDMKALSATSVGCLAAVRRTEEFGRRAKLILCEEAVNSGVLEESAYPWKHLSLDLALPVEVVGRINDTLETALSITLRLAEKKDDEDMIHYLMEIFTKTKKLRTLEMDAFIFNNNVLHDVFSDAGVQALMTHLECLAIQSHCDNPKSVCYIDSADDDEADTPLQQNLLQLSMVPLQLKKFVFGKILITNKESESDHVKFVPKIVDAAKNTLEELELHLNVWISDEMKVIRCPKLKCLVLSVKGDETKIVKTFIENQPPLEELVIAMRKTFPYNIFLVLQGMVKSKMKKLHMEAKGFSTYVDWSFLASMSELKDFHIRDLHGLYDHIGLYCGGEDILMKLPNGVQSISLQGFNPFWKKQYPGTGNIGVLMGRFENLTEVNLLKSDDAFTDEGLQRLITNCRKLTSLSLSFSHFSEVTDFGISGIRKQENGSGEEKVGVSLNDLKGLIRLKINECGNVSLDCLFKVVEFPCLRYFEYYNSDHQLPKDFVLQIVRQNPCLEEVALPITSSKSDANYVHQLRREVKEINSWVHFVEIQERLNWQDADTDSDASSLNEDGGSDSSGSDYNSDDHYDPRVVVFGESDYDTD